MIVRISSMLILIIDMKAEIWFVEQWN